MVAEVKLSEDQKRSLEMAIYHKLVSEGVPSPTGLEVNWVHQFHDGEYRIHYSYEDHKNRDRTSDFYGKFLICHNSITDLEESK